MTMTMNPLAGPAPAAKSASAGAGVTPAAAVGTAAKAADARFAPLIGAQAARDGGSAGQETASAGPGGANGATRTNGTQGANGVDTGNGAGGTDSGEDRGAIDVLDAALAQALDELIGRAPTAGGAAIAVAIGSSDDGDGGSLDDAVPAALPAGATGPLMAMLMPTLIPAVMPPPAAPRDAKAEAEAAPAGVPSTSALTADPARLLSIQGVDAATAATAGAANAMPLPATPDTASWQGLQRWSADLMTAMTPSTGAAISSDGSTPTATLTLPAARDAWSQPLMQALGDRLQLQIAQRIDSARLHLSPPQLGRIEIDIRQQGGALQVQLSASNDEVRQQLRQIAEPLRHELVQRHAGDVSVQVASGAQAAGDGRGRDGAAGGGQPQSNGQPREQRQPGRALGEDDGGAGQAATFAEAFDGQASAVNTSRTSR